MYTQALDLPQQKPEPAEPRGPRSVEQIEREARYQREFDEKLARGEPLDFAGDARRMMERENERARTDR